jgi:hypothetical protein
MSVEPLTDAERERFALFLHDPQHQAEVGAAVRAEARRDPAWMGALIRRELRLVGRPPITRSTR